VEKIKLFWLLSVVLLPFAEIHRSRSETTNQSQEEWLSSVNHAARVRLLQKLATAASTRKINVFTA